ncbi:MAG: biopolymer transporter ExbD [Myxococcota bacterium]|nr:biopolymer transporter ExbD [Myxococcota bacterium]
MSKRRRVNRRRMVLQLTSLLDMFTIILVFLMVSFQAEDKDFVLHAGVKLPASDAKSPFKTGVNMAITKQAVLIEGKQIYAFEEGGLVSDEQYATGRIDSVVAGVNETWKTLKRGRDEENIVVIQADKDLPYRTIHLVMRSAAHAGAFRFRLVIEKE